MKAKAQVLFVCVIGLMMTVFQLAHAESVRVAKSVVAPLELDVKMQTTGQLAGPGFNTVSASCGANLKIQKFANLLIATGTASCSAKGWERNRWSPHIVLFDKSNEITLTQEQSEAGTFYWAVLPVGSDSFGILLSPPLPSKTEVFSMKEAVFEWQSTALYQVSQHVK